jgi:hypothetical protein
VRRTEAVAAALAASPERLSSILDDANASASWRRQLDVSDPSADLASAVEYLTSVVSGTPVVEAALAGMDERPAGGDYGHLVRAILRSKLGRRGPAG